MKDLIKVACIFLVFMAATLSMFAALIHFGRSGGSKYNQGRIDQYKEDMTQIRKTMNNPNDYYNFLSTQEVDEVIMPAYEKELIFTVEEIMKCK